MSRPFSIRQHIYTEQIWMAWHVRSSLAGFYNSRLSLEVPVFDNTRRCRMCDIAMWKHKGFNRQCPGVIHRGTGFVHVFSLPCKFQRISRAATAIKSSRLCMPWTMENAGNWRVEIYPRRSWWGQASSRTWLFSLSNTLQQESDRHNSNVA